VEQWYSSKFKGSKAYHVLRASPTDTAKQRRALVLGILQSLLGKMRNS